MEMIFNCFGDDDDQHTPQYDPSTSVLDPKETTVVWDREGNALLINATCQFDECRQQSALPPTTEMVNYLCGQAATKHIRLDIPDELTDSQREETKPLGDAESTMWRPYLLSDKPLPLVEQMEWDMGKQCVAEYIQEN